MTHAGGAGMCERLSDSVVTSSVGDEMVVLDLESGLHHSPNEVGALIYAVSPTARPATSSSRT